MYEKTEEIFLASVVWIVFEQAIIKNKNKIEKPILNFKKDQYVDDWFSCSFI